MKNRNLVILPFILINLISCEQEKNDKRYYVRDYYENGKKIVDSVVIENSIYSPKEDSLFYKKEILVNGRIHTLKKYSNIHKSPIDGEHVYYELDDWGVIYYSSLSWKSSKTLHSNNDSIEMIINKAIEKALFFSEIDIMNNFHNHPKLPKPLKL